MIYNIGCCNSGSLPKKWDQPIWGRNNPIGITKRGSISGGCHKKCKVNEFTWPMAMWHSHIPHVTRAPGGEDGFGPTLIHAEHSLTH
jgi:hypothetical protein